MIDPVNPGPAGTQGPAGSGLGPPGPFAVDAVLQYGTAIVQDAIGKATGAIKSLVDQAIGTVQQSIQTAAGSVASAVNQGQTALTVAASQAQTAIQSQLAQATPAKATGSTAEQGAQPGQYAWEIWSVKSLSGWGKGVVEPRASGYSSGPDYCFRGGSDDYFDAINMAKGLPQLPYGACPSPGGIAAPPVAGPQPPPQCPMYQVWESRGPDNNPVCTVQCAGVPGPPGAFPYGPQQDLQGAQILVANICGPGQPTGTGPSVQYYGGCGADGKPATWDSSTGPPAGVSGQVGPFATASEALSAAGSCGSGGGPPSTGQPPSGMCCDPATGEVKLPKCIFIDLCDWKTFHDNMLDAIYRALCKFVKDPDCNCALQDGDRFVFEDCDGQVDTASSQWLGKLGSILSQSSVDALVANGAQIASSLGNETGDTGPDPWQP